MQAAPRPKSSPPMERGSQRSTITLAYLFASTCITIALASTSPWTRSWLYSGAAIESLLVLVGPPFGPPSKLFVFVCLNAIFIIVSTSWLLHAAFALACWPIVLVTCLLQYALLSSFARARLRRLFKYLHVYRDRLGFFDLPVLILDAGMKGLVAVRGFNLSVLELKLECYGIEISLDVAQGHEVAIYVDKLEIHLLRRIAVDEIYAVHRSSIEEGEISGGQTFTPDKPSKKDETDGDHFSKIYQDCHSETNRDAATPDSTPVVLPVDSEAEERYEAILHHIRTSTRLHKCRTHVKNTRARDDADGESEQRAAICSELRKMDSISSSSSKGVALSRLTAVFTPMMRLFEHIPLVLRVILTLLSHLHPVDCPAICVGTSGRWANETVLNMLKKRHDTQDNKILALTDEVSSFLTTAHFCVEFDHVSGISLVPLIARNNISCELRSRGIVASRTSKSNSDVEKAIQLKGGDATFVLPTYLLPCHSHLVPKLTVSDDIDHVVGHDDAEDEDSAEISVNIRVTLPARFDQSFVDFATTLAKVSQMLDIEMEHPSSPAYKSASSHGGPDESRDEYDHHGLNHSLKDKLAHGRLGAAVRHTAQGARSAIHREAKKAAVDKVDGAWFAKWTDKMLGQLEYLSGDVGYSAKLAVQLQPYRR